MAVLQVPSITYPTISSAITAAANGDTILVQPGTYTEGGGNPLLNITKSLTIKSTGGAASTILQGSASTYYVVQIAADNVTLDGFTITTPLYDSTSDASGVIFTGGRPSNTKLLNNIVHDIGTMTRSTVSFGSYGFNMGPADGLEIGNNTVYSIGNADPDAQAIGIFVWGNDATDTGTNINIHDNTVYDIVNPSNVNDAIYSAGFTENVTVANNTLSGPQLKRGIVTSAGMSGPITITGNTISGATVNGIRLQSPNAQTVTGNTITNCDIGIKIQPTVTTTPEIHDNNIVGNTTDGLANDPVSVDAQYNWWGSASGPNTPGADSTSGIDPAAYTPWLVAPAGTVILTTGPIANPMVGSNRQTVQVMVMAENVGASEESLLVNGYYLDGTQTLYVQTLMALAASETDGSVYSQTFYADFDGYQFQFAPSSSNVLISVWGLAADGSLVAAHRVVNRELSPVVS